MVYEGARGGPAKGTETRDATAKRGEMTNQKWIRLYFDLKINEERVILKRSKYLNIVRKAQEMLKVATVQEAVEYINKEIYKRVQTLVQGPNVNSSYHNLPGSNTLKKLSEYF